MYSTKQHDSCHRALVLMYHRIASHGLDPWGLCVSYQNFAQQLPVIRRFGTPISLLDFVDAFQSGSLPERSIILTFDDGYLDNLTHALPLLNQHRIPATIFVSTGYSNRPAFWWDQLETALLRPNRLPDSLSLQFKEGLRHWHLGKAATYSHEQYLEDPEG